MSQGNGGICHVFQGAFSTILLSEIKIAKGKIAMDSTFGLAAISDYRALSSLKTRLGRG
jgi:hypothetical protein